MVPTARINLSLSRRTLPSVTPLILWATPTSSVTYNMRQKEHTKSLLNPSLLINIRLVLTQHCQISLPMSWTHHYVRRTHCRFEAFKWESLPPVTSLSSLSWHFVGSSGCCRHRDAIGISISHISNCFPLSKRRVYIQRLCCKCARCCSRRNIQKCLG